ncbi:hypothetical protein BU16DRAFT_305404 [Lophium mytilinum]|uniref:Uncharacterized protein n=1 Tax=Lophium mytilinum TaxID=390894 RepID=A0A6A6R2S1_9PEZI|nr:hypothetical protein BU16DRAFT_305404 [Lophium mytilinum]
MKAFVLPFPQHSCGPHPYLSGRAIFPPKRCCSTWGMELRRWSTGNEKNTLHPGLPIDRSLRLAHRSKIQWVVKQLHASEGDVDSVVEWTITQLKDKALKVMKEDNQDAQDAIEQLELLKKQAVCERDFQNHAVFAKLSEKANSQGSLLAAGKWYS